MSFSNQVPPSTIGTSCSNIDWGKAVTMTTEGKLISCQNGIWALATTPDYAALYRDLYPAPGSLVTARFAANHPERTVALVMAPPESPPHVTGVSHCKMRPSSTKRSMM